MSAPRRLLSLTVVLLLTAPVLAADTQVDANALSLQVTALEMLHRFQASPEQLAALLKLAKDTPPKESTRKAGKVSDKFRQMLTALRDAYVAGDEDAITAKASDLDDLREKEDPDLDDDVELSDAARKTASAALKVFTPRQVALYLVEFSEEFPVPFEKITEAFDDALTLKGKDWDEARDLVADQVGWLIGGLDAAAEAKVKKQVAELLDRVHILKAADFKDQKAELTKQAQEIADAAGPVDVFRNFMERSVAELLSNPQTATVLEARLKRVK